MGFYTVPESRAIKSPVARPGSMKHYKRGLIMGISLSYRNTGRGAPRFGVACFVARGVSHGR